jgi:MFS family permease
MASLNQTTPSRPRWTLRACCTAHVLHDGLVDMLYALLPLLAQTLGLSYAQVGLIRAANKIATAGLQLPMGLLAERFGATGLLVLGTCVAGTAFIGLSFTESFIPVLIGFCVAGCGNAVQHPLASSLITGAYTSVGRTRALGIYNMYGDIGKFTFMGATVAMLGAGLSWQWSVMSFGIVAIAVGAAIWFMLRVLITGSEDASSKPNAAPAEGGWGIKSPRGALALGAIASIDSASRVAFLTFVAFLMIDKGIDAAWAAASVLVTLFGGMCGKFACGLLAERLGIVKTVLLTELGTALGIVAVVVLPAGAAFVLLPFLGVFLNGTSSVIYATVGALVDDHRHARAYGLIYTVGSVCGIVSPLGFGLIADAGGVTHAMLWIAAMLCATFAFLPLLNAAFAEAAMRERMPLDKT